MRNIAAGLTLAVLLAGCGHSSPPQSASSTVTSTLTATPTNTDVNNNGTPDNDDTAADFPGKMVPVYQPATSAEAIRGKAFMEENSMAEQFADAINDTLKLPHDIRVVGQQCDEDNLWFDIGDQSVALCYERAANLREWADSVEGADPTTVAFDTMLLGYYHEVGHMAINVYDLPAVGREEDDADQVSTYLMLWPNDDGTIDRDALDAVGYRAQYYRGSSDDIDDSDLSDEHSLDKVRMYNLECWTYGADPAYGAGLVAKGLLPQDRADGCEDEWAKLRSAWDRLLEPYLK